VLVIQCRGLPYSAGELYVKACSFQTLSARLSDIPMES
jgi:hypothetical protein